MGGCCLVFQAKVLARGDEVWRTNSVGSMEALFVLGGGTRGGRGGTSVFLVSEDCVGYADVLERLALL